MNWRKLHSLADALTPTLRRKIARAFKQAADQNSLLTLIRVIESGNLSPRQIALLTQNLPLIMQQATLPTLTTAIKGAAKIEIQEVSGFGITIDFARVNPYAVTAAQNQAAYLVTRVSLQTKAAIRSVITEALKQGITPRDTARILKPMIGLTQRQALAVMNFRERMRNAGATVSQAQSAAAKYTQQLLRERSMTIARTELIDSMTRGQRATWLAGRRDGKMPFGARAEWIVTPDDRLCPRCMAMDGETADIEGVFKGGIIGPTLHPRCRCAIGLNAASMKVRRPSRRRSA